MTPKTVVGSLNQICYSLPSTTGLIDESMWCSRCGAVMQEIGSSVQPMGRHLRVESPIIVFLCPRCGYSECSWTC